MVSRFDDISHFLFQMRHGPPQSRQLWQEHDHPKPFSMRSGIKAARTYRSRRNRPKNARSRADLGAISDPQMINDPNTTAKQDIPADPSASRDAGLRGDKRIFAHDYIVCDLDKVVDLDASTNKGSS